MRAAAAMARLPVDILDGERGPDRAAAVAATRSPTDFLFVLYRSQPAADDAAQAALVSLLRARSGTGKEAPFGTAAVLVLCGGETQPEWSDVWALPWAEAGIAVGVRRVTLPKPPEDEDCPPVVAGALDRLAAIRVATETARKQQRHLVWFEPGMLFGADPAKELWTYSLRPAFLAGHLPRSYSTAMLLVPLAGVSVVDTLLTMTANALRRDLRQGRAALITRSGSCGALLDEYVTEELGRKRVPYQVLARTRFMPAASVQTVLRSRPAAGRVAVTDVFGQPTPVLADFLAQVDSAEGSQP